MLLAAVCLAVTACDNDTLPANGQANVEISLQAEDGFGSVSDAEILLNCRAGSGMVSVPAEKTADGHYAATLPSQSVSANNFVEVHWGDTVYAYTPSSPLRFEGGTKYNYSFKLTADGLQPAAGFGITITDWEVVDTGGAVFATTSK